MDAPWPLGNEIECPYDVLHAISNRATVLYGIIKSKPKNASERKFRMYPTAPDPVFCVRLRGDEKVFAQNNTASVLHQYVNMTDMRGWGVGGWGGTTAFFLSSLALGDRATG